MSSSVDRLSDSDRALTKLIEAVERDYWQNGSILLDSTATLANSLKL